MKLSVIVPVFNEKNTIEMLIEKLIAVPIDKEIIIVDDGSTDGTTRILKKISEQNPGLIKVIFQPRNMGKGYAIRKAIVQVTGDVVIIQDADLEYEPMDYLRMIEPIKQGRADVVYGSRILGKNPVSSFSFYVGGRFLSLLTNILYGTSITDEPTCYKMFKSDILKSVKLNCKRFEFCPEITARIAKKKIKIYEVPIRYSPRRIKEGKKIRWKDGIIAVWTLIKYRF